MFLITFFPSSPARFLRRSMYQKQWVDLNFLCVMSGFIKFNHCSCSSCLQSWLEQDTSCPTCRMVLSIQSPAGLEAASRLEHNLLAGENQVDNQTTNRRPPNHFFHFDGKYRIQTFFLAPLTVYLLVIYIRNFKPVMY